VPAYEHMRPVPMRFIDSRKPRQKHLQKKKTPAPFDTHARGHWSTWMFDLLDTHTHTLIMCTLPSSHGFNVLTCV
jgi:hypothetical protein